MTSARDFTVRLAHLLRRERAALAEFLVALADFDRQRLWLDLGHASLFYFLHRELGLSKGRHLWISIAAVVLIQRKSRFIRVNRCVPARQKWRRDLRRRPRRHVRRSPRPSRSPAT